MQAVYRKPTGGGNWVLYLFNEDESTYKYKLLQPKSAPSYQDAYMYLGPKRAYPWPSKTLKRFENALGGGWERLYQSASGSITRHL